MTARERAQAHVDGVKAERDHACFDCGDRLAPHCLDFDHLGLAPKVANVSDLVNQGAPIDVIDNEIAKCELVCANCHRDRTMNRIDDARYVRRIAPTLPLAEALAFAQMLHEDEVEAFANGEVASIRTRSMADE